MGKSKLMKLMSAYMEDISMKKEEQVKRCEELIDKTRAHIILCVEDRAPEFWSEKELRLYIAQNFATLAFIPLGCERAREYNNSRIELKL